MLRLGPSASSPDATVTTAATDCHDAIAAGRAAPAGRATAPFPPPSPSSRRAGGRPYRPEDHLVRPLDDVLDQAVITALDAAEPGRLVRRCVDGTRDLRGLCLGLATYRQLQRHVAMPAADDLASWARLEHQMRLVELLPERAALDEVIWEAAADLVEHEHFGRLRAWDGQGVAERLHLHSLTRLQTLDLSGRGLRELELAQMLPTLALMRELRGLSLAHNELEDAAMRPLAVRLLFWPELTSLRIDGNPWGAPAATALQEAVATAMPRAGELEAAVWDGSFSRQSLEEVPVCPQLCDLGPPWRLSPPFVAVAARLRRRRQQLAAGSAPPPALSAGDQDVAELWAVGRVAARIESGIALQAELRGCRDGATLVATLQRAGAALPRSESLDLGGRPLTAAQQRGLVDQLRDGGRSLRWLTLASCALGDAGLAHLGDALAQLPELRACDLRDNAFGSAGVAGLCAGIAAAPSLTTVLVDPPWWAAVREALSAAAGHLPAGSRFSDKDGTSMGWEAALADADTIDHALLAVVEGLAEGVDSLRRGVVRGSEFKQQMAAASIQMGAVRGVGTSKQARRAARA